jgi:hypothetical protein
MKLSPERFELIESFENYIARGGDILSFAEYYNTTNYFEDLHPVKEVIILGLCEEYARVGEYDRIFQILNTVFSLEKWKLDNFKRFMGCVKDSEILEPLYKSIFNLYENCKNYIKCS